MATRTVASPDPGFTGARAGVTFQDGRGEVDAGSTPALAYFARHGYAVEVGSSPPKKEWSSARATAAKAADATPRPETGA